MLGAAFLRHVTYLPVFGAFYLLGATAQLSTFSIGDLLLLSYFLYPHPGSACPAVSI